MAALFFGMIWSSWLGAPVWAADSAVILIYHRFGDDRFAATNIRLDQFDAHIAELTSGRYTVWPLRDIVAAFKSGRELPDRTVAITIDDAYASVYKEAWPRLKAAGLPFTLFVATGPIDENSADFMGWAELKEMAAAGVEIGNHTVSHSHMIGRPAAENRAEIEGAQHRLSEELGIEPTFFAFPYGEYGNNETALIERMGFEAAFAQYSSVAYSADHLFSLPRFALNESYGGIDRFRLLVNALPIPARDFVPDNPVIESNPPVFGFSLVQALDRLDQLACYPSHMGEPAAITLLGDRRVEVRFDRPFPQGRNRINCTMPGPDGRWRWLGQPFFVP